MEDIFLKKIQETLCYLVEQYPLPTTRSAFIDMMNALVHHHEEQTACLYSYMRDSCTREEIAFYVCTETSVDNYFDDFLALCQLGLPTVLKLNIAKNYWSEMGDGDHNKIHTNLFVRSRDFCRSILVGYHLPNTSHMLESANRFFLYGLRRRYNYRLLGSLFLLN